MLTADEYFNQYPSYDRRALQLSKYYLSRWGKIERNASELSELHSEIAYILFSALNEMTEKEREFLGDKYRVIIFGRVAKSDKEMASQYNMKLVDYQNLRKGIEYKFYHKMKPLLQELKGDDFFN